MIIFLILYVISQPIDADCDTLISIGQQIKLQRPIVILFYMPYGSIYQSLKEQWIQLANDKSIKINDYYQVHMEDKRCVKEMFGSLFLPGLMYVDKNKLYQYEVVRNEEDIKRMSQGISNIEQKQYPELTLYLKILTLIFEPITYSIIQTILFSCFILIVIKIRLRMYVENDDIDPNVCQETQLKDKIV